MAIRSRDYILTTHSKERFVQRTDKKYQHLWRCKWRNCEQCKRLVHESIVELSTRNSIDDEILMRIERSEENKSYINNTAFMTWYWEKYGYDKHFKFLVENDLVFVIVIDCGKKVVLTCMSAKTHFVGVTHLSRRKFNKVNKINRCSDPA